MITDFTLLEVATVQSDLTLSDYEECRAYTVKQRVYAGEPLCVMAVKDSNIDITDFYDYCGMETVE